MIELNLIPQNDMAREAAARIGGGLTGAGGIHGLTGTNPMDAAAPGSFATMLRDALQEVSAAQNRSSGLQQDFQLGRPGASLEETMLAMQTSSIGFQSALTVRNRVVQAYSEIMSLSV